VPRKYSDPAAEAVDVEKAKKKRRRTATVHFYENMNKPARARSETLAELHRDDAEGVAEPDETKGTMGNVPPGRGQSLSDARVSPPVTAGHQASSTGDHGAAMASDPMCVPGPRELAWQHPDLRQQSVSFNDVIARLRTVNGDDQNGDRSITYRAGEVGLSLFNARGAAGAYPGMQPVGHIPQRPDWHQSRGSATPPNGSHSTVNPSRPPTQAMKASEARAMLKAHMFPGSGAR
jgi:hypothetical protein